MRHEGDAGGKFVNESHFSQNRREMGHPLAVAAGKVRVRGIGHERAAGGHIAQGGNACG